MEDKTKILGIPVEELEKAVQGRLATGITRTSSWLRGQNGHPSVRGIELHGL
jgi:hypothetical protein